MRHRIACGSLILALTTLPLATFAKPVKMLEVTGDTVYSLQLQDVDNTSGGSGLLTLSPMRNGLVKVNEAGSAAYNDTKKLQNGDAVAQGGGFAVGNIQPDGTIKVIPEGPTVKYFNLVAGVLAAAPDRPKKGDTWTANVSFPGSTGQAIIHIAMTATVTAQARGGMTISFDGNSDDAPVKGVLFANAIRAKTHTFGTIGIVNDEMQTADGETDLTVMKRGRNEKWSLRRG